MSQFLSGVIVDRFNKKKVSIYVYLISAALMLSIVLTNDTYLLLPYAYKMQEAEAEKFTLFLHAKKGLAEVKKLPLIQYTMLASVFFGMLGRFYEIDKVYVADTTSALFLRRSWLT